MIIQAHGRSVQVGVHRFTNVSRRWFVAQQLDAPYHQIDMATDNPLETDEALMERGVKRVMEAWGG